MDPGEKTQLAAVVTRTEHAGGRHGTCGDALRANAIGSLWGRSAGEPGIRHGDLWAVRADTLR